MLPSAASDASSKPVPRRRPSRTHGCSGIHRRLVAGQVRPLPAASSLGRSSRWFSVPWNIRRLVESIASALARLVLIRTGRTLPPLEPGPATMSFGLPPTVTKSLSADLGERLEDLRVGDLTLGAPHGQRSPTEIAGGVLASSSSHRTSPWCRRRMVLMAAALVRCSLPKDIPSRFMRGVEALGRP